MSDHDDYEGLAAGYALHALEPEDEQRLAAHLLTCQDCARIVADAASVGAALSELIIDDAAPPAGLRDRILAAAAAEPRRQPARPPAPAPETLTIPSPAHRGSRVVHQDRATKARRFQVRSRIAVGVLAAVIGVGVAVPVTLAASGNGSSGNSAFASALLEPGARELTLNGSNGSVAKAVMTQKAVFVAADKLPVNDRADSIYVLWMAGSDGKAAAVATFDVTNSKPVELKITKLPMATSLIKKVAVSREPGRKAPASPSEIVVTSA
jgi:hypothetical protein